MLSSAEQDNLQKFQNGMRGFYEVYYLKLNDLASNFALWLRYTILAPKNPKKEPVAETWAIAFDPDGTGSHVALKATYPIDALETEPDRLNLRIAESLLTHGSAAGAIQNQEHSISWNLAYEPNREGFRHFPGKLLYRLPIPKTKVFSPNVDLLVNGTVIVSERRRDERRIDLANAPGMQAHLYGTSHADSWAWGHVNAFSEGRRGWFEALSAKIRVGPFETPALTLAALHLDGRTFRFNRFTQLISNKSFLEEPRFRLNCSGTDARLEAELSAPKDAFVGVRYEDPDGSYRYCRNTKVADAKLTLSPTGGEPVILTSEGRAALEFVDRSERPGIETQI